MYMHFLIAMNSLSFVVFYQLIKTHGNVSCGPRIRGACKQFQYLHVQNTVWFSVLWPLSKLLWRCWLTRVDHILKLKKITLAIVKMQTCKNSPQVSSFFFFFCTLANYHKIQTRKPIALKFGTHEKGYIYIYIYRAHCGNY